MKRAGRPKQTENLDLVTLDECIERAQEYLKMPMPPFQRRTLQNKLSAGEFERYGTYRCPMVDWNEVKRSLNWKKRVG